MVCKSKRDMQAAQQHTRGVCATHSGPFREHDLWHNAPHSASQFLTQTGDECTTSGTVRMCFHFYWIIINNDMKHMRYVYPARKAYRVDDYLEFLRANEDLQKLEVVPISVHKSAEPAPT